MTTESALISYAIAFAANAHAGQVYGESEPYIMHPLRVYQRVLTHPLAERIAAILHDTVEDSNVTIEDVREKFGEDIAELVDALTHRPNEPYVDYILRLRDCLPARGIKVTDIRENSQNLFTMRDRDRAERLRKKYKNAMVLLEAPCKRNASTPKQIPDKEITLNRAKCKLCGDIVTSRYTHDFQTCGCTEIFVDGGTSYIRRGANHSLDNIIEMSEYAA